MSGGVAYVYDPADNFSEPLQSADGGARGAARSLTTAPTMSRPCWTMLRSHVRFTGSTAGGGPPGGLGVGDGPLRQGDPEATTSASSWPRRARARNHASRRSPSWSGRSSMGKPTGFIEIKRAKPRRAADPRARPRLAGSLSARARAEDARPGRALHGLRDSVLPSGVPARQRDSRLERSRLPPALAGRERSAARHQQLSGVDRTPVPGAVRGRVRARHQRRPGDDQDRSSSRSSSTRSSEGWIQARPPVGAHAASASPSSARGRPASPPPTS